MDLNTGTTVRELVCLNSPSKFSYWWSPSPSQSYVLMPYCRKFLSVCFKVSQLFLLFPKNNLNHLFVWVMKLFLFYAVFWRKSGGTVHLGAVLEERSQRRARGRKHFWRSMSRRRTWETSLWVNTQRKSSSLASLW